MHRLRIVRACERDDAKWPDPGGSADRLAAAAKAEGHAFLGRLVSDWRSGENRFEHTGEGLWLAWSGSRLVGTCGLNRDPFVAEDRAGRLRRLYVSAEWRRRGVASWLTLVALAAAPAAFDRVRLRALAPEALAFYGARGFIQIDDETATHILRVGAS